MRCRWSCPTMAAFPNATARSDRPMIRRTSAWEQFADGLQAGDPLAYGLLGFACLLGLAVVSVVIIEFRNKQKAKPKSKTKRWD